MQDQLDAILDLKTKAKNRRDLKRYKAAVSILDKAIRRAKEGLYDAKTSSSKSRFAKELSDCYGMQGGIHRRWGIEAYDDVESPLDSVQAKKLKDLHLAKSIEAYDEGFMYESNADYGIIDSYNLVNRLVSRLLYDPTWLESKPKDVPTDIKPLAKEEHQDNVRVQLHSAAKIIREQLKLPRRRDIWALADLALVSVLLNEEGDSWGSAYSDFVAAVPPSYAYESAISALQPLAKLNIPPKRKLTKALEQLREALEQQQMKEAME